MRILAAFAALLLLFSAPATARDLGGINIPDSLTLAGETTPLILNGAGYRKKLFIKVYIGALYVAQPLNQAEAILNATTPRAMRMHFLRDLGQDQFTAAWDSAIKPNHTEVEMRALHARLEELGRLAGNLRRNDVLRIEMRPGGETEISVNNLQRGILRGADLQRALLTAWIGAIPADADLKRSLLGSKDS